MKALTLTQPWATLVAAHVKWIETRSWSTRYRGPLAIHSSKRMTAEDQQFAMTLALDGTIPVPPDMGWDGIRYPLGCIVATVTLHDVLPIDEFLIVSEVQERYGDFTPGRFAWVLADIKRLPEPIPAVGHQRLWEWADA